MFGAPAHDRRIVRQILRDSESVETNNPLILGIVGNDPEVKNERGSRHPKTVTLYLDSEQLTVGAKQEFARIFKLQPGSQAPITEQPAEKNPIPVLDDGQFAIYEGQYHEGFDCNNPPRAALAITADSELFRKVQEAYAATSPGF
jgi:hypothetical protein